MLNCLSYFVKGDIYVNTCFLNADDFEPKVESLETCNTLVFINYVQEIIKIHEPHFVPPINYYYSCYDGYAFIEKTTES